MAQVLFFLINVSRRLLSDFLIPITICLSCLESKALEKTESIINIFILYLFFYDLWVYIKVSFIDSKFPVLTRRSSLINKHSYSYGHTCIYVTQASYLTDQHDPLSDKIIATPVLTVGWNHVCLILIQLFSLEYLNFVYFILRTVSLPPENAAHFLYLVYLYLKIHSWCFLFWFILPNIMICK